MALSFKSLLLQVLNSFETMKNDSILMKFGTNVSLCNSMLNRKFPVTMATGRRLKIAKIHYFAYIFVVFFPSKLISMCCNFSMNSDRVKGFSA
jgi:hypothetical protein